MKKFMEAVERHLVPIASKVGANRYLSALRDGFVATLAIMMAGSVVTLVNNLPLNFDYKGALNNATGGFYGAWIGQVWWATLAMTTLYVVIAISYALAKSYGEDDIAAPIVALASYLAAAPQTVGGNWGGVPWSVTKTDAMMAGMIIAFVSTEMFIRLRKSPKLEIKLPDGVPPAVSRAFAKLLPGLITILVMAVFGAVTLRTPQGSFALFINDTIAKPLQVATDTLGGAILIPFFNQFLWFFGLHGSNILAGITGPIMVPLLENNINIVNGINPNGEYAVLAGRFFDAFVYMGGSGTTVGLLISIFLTSKSKHHREVAKLGFGPACFNINEPIIFGLPLVLNPVFAIPFIFVPPILGALAFLGTKAGIVPYIIADIPWTAPPGLGGFLATGSFMGAAMALVNLALSVVLYMPFVMIASSIDAKKEKEAEAAEAEASSI